AEREEREQGDAVGETFVEGPLVDVREVEEVSTKTVQDGVGRLVDDDVVRERRIHPLAGVQRRREVPEEQSLVVSRVEGVRPSKRVRRDLELLALEAPRDPPPERTLEDRDRSHREGEDVLRMEGGVGGDVRELAVERRPGGRLPRAVLPIGRRVVV